VSLFAGAALAGVVFSGFVAWGHPILSARWGLLWRLALWAAVGAVGTLAALRLPRRLALILGVLAAAAVRIAALAGPATTSDDLYRYAWDGRVQAAGIDPYRYPPAAPEMAGLREPWLWPDPAGCAALGRAPACTRINRPQVRTIYPPLAEAWFGVVYRVTGIGHRDKPWQAAGLLTDLATVGLLVVGLRRWGRDPRWVAMYALSPAPVLEFVNNGHVDGLAVTFVVAAVVAAGAGAGSPKRAPALGRDVAVGLLVGAAALVKLYPGILLVALVGLPRARPWRSAIRSAAAAGVLALAAYLPHVLRVGIHVLGYLPGYLIEEHYDGGRFVLAGALGLSGVAADAAASLAVAGAVGWVLWRRPDATRAGALLLAVLLLTTTPVQPWYAVSLLAVATLAAWPWWAPVVAAGYPYFFAVILVHPSITGIGQASYGAALVLVVFFALRHRIEPQLQRNRMVGGESGSRDRRHRHQTGITVEVECEIERTRRGRRRWGRPGARGLQGGGLGVTEVDVPAGARSGVHVVGLIPRPVVVLDGDAAGVDRGGDRHVAERTAGPHRDRHTARGQPRGRGRAAVGRGHGVVRHDRDLDGEHDHAGRWVEGRRRQDSKGAGWHGGAIALGVALGGRFPRQQGC
jgi:hypothetical protein